jgi:2-polyprenyl-6-methoxyphenol hydroxylase-like FAD-dependent oxidoreductase
MSRSDYVDVLYEEARRLGVEVKCNCEVREISFDVNDPWVQSTSGDIYRGDVVIGCDGKNTIATVELLISLIVK